MDNIIIKPILTEKMTAQGEKLSRYGFVVSREADKNQIKMAVEKAYGVAVADVNTMIYMGKAKRRYTKAGLMVGRSNHTKKAIVTLKAGNAIDFYGNI
jgi:large subunit ribosomal protein L23